VVECGEECKSEYIIEQPVSHNEFIIMQHVEHIGQLKAKVPFILSFFICKSKIEDTWCIDLIIKFLKREKKSKKIHIQICQ